MEANSPQNLGFYLRSERERRGLSLEQLSSATRISLKILEAIEENRSGDLPALPFLKGFIRSICKTLGIDPENLFEKYGTEVSKISEQRPQKLSHQEGYAFDSVEGDRSKRVLMLAMTFSLVIGAFVVLVVRPSLKHRKHATQEKLMAESESVSPDIVPTPVIVPSGTATPSNKITDNEVVTESAPKIVASTPVSPAVEPVKQKVPEKKSEPAVSTTALTPETAVEDDLQSGKDYDAKEVKQRIVLRALADVWVRYRCDDKKLMKFLLKKGKVLVLRGKESVFFQASNSDSVRIAVGGKPAALLSQSTAQFEVKDTPTVVFPETKKAALAEQYANEKALPVTPSPTLETPPLQINP